MIGSTISATLPAAPTLVFRPGVHAADPSDLMRRLVKEDLYTFDGRPLFPERRSYTAQYKLTAGEDELYREVTSYVRAEMSLNGDASA